MMYNEADMVISFVSHGNEPFTLPKYSQILICQNQKLQIPIFMINKALYEHLTKFNYDNSLIEIWHIRPNVPVDFSRIFFPTLFIIFPESILQRNLFNLPCHLRYKIYSVKIKRFQRFALADHVRWCCMHAEQYYQMLFVHPSTIFWITIAVEVNQNIITLMASAVNANLTVVLGDAFLTVCIY